MTSTHKNDGKLFAAILIALAVISLFVVFLPGCVVSGEGVLPLERPIRGEAPYLHVPPPTRLGPNNFEFVAILKGEIRPQHEAEWRCAWIDWDFGDRGWNDGQGALAQKPGRRVVTYCGVDAIERTYHGWHWYKLNPGPGKKFEVYAVLRSWRTHRELARVKVSRTLYLVN